MNWQKGGLWRRFYVPRNNYFFFLLRTPFMEGLSFLSVRWIQPIQQQGRRSPSLSRLTTCRTWSFLVSPFFTEIVQQIHSLRASGVRLSHAATAALLADSVVCRSLGTLCTVPCASVIDEFYQNKSRPKAAGVDAWVAREDRERYGRRTPVGRSGTGHWPLKNHSSIQGGVYPNHCLAGGV